MTAAGLFWLLAAAFFLNDLLFIYWSGQQEIYLADYAVRIFVIVLCFGLPRLRAVATGAMSDRRLGRWAVLASIPLIVICDRLAQTIVEPAVIGLFGRTGLFYFGMIESPHLRLFDLTMGLLLVAVSEELVFRKFALNWLRSAGLGALGCILISAAVFAAMHWGSGVERVAATFVFGVVAMAFYIRHTVLWPLVLAHYITNLIAFS